MSLPAFRSADPVRTYYSHNGAWAFFSALTFTLSMVYYVRDAGLNPLQSGRAARLRPAREDVSLPA